MSLSALDRPPLAGVRRDGTPVLPPPPRRSLPPRTVTRLLLGLGALLLLAAALLAVPRLGGPVVTGAPVVDRGPVMTTLAGYGPQGSHVLAYEHGAAVELRLPLRNDSPLPLTVTQASLDVGVAPLVDVTLDQPLRLAAGEVGEVVLRGAMGNCRWYHERELSIIGGVRLTQQVLGLSHTRVVPLDRPVLVHSPMIVGCPDRKLDRQADDKVDLFRGIARS